MKIPFDIEYRPEIESGKYRLTSKGYPVEVLKWDMAASDDCCIVGVVKDKDGEFVMTWNEHGDSHTQDDFDLNIETDDPEEETLTEFEDTFRNIILDEFGAVVEETVAHNIKSACQRLLEIARKEFEPELEAAYKSADEVQYLNGYRNGVMEAKDFEELMDDLYNVDVSINKPYVNVELPSVGKKNGNICITVHNLTYQQGNVIKKIVRSW